MERLAAANGRVGLSNYFYGAAYCAVDFWPATPDTLLFALAYFAFFIYYI